MDSVIVCYTLFHFGKVYIWQKLDCRLANKSAAKLRRYLFCPMSHTSSMEAGCTFTDALNHCPFHAG